MYTQFDKAIVSVIMAIILVLQRVFKISLGLDEDTITIIITALTPLIVYLFPNAPKDKTP